jgi:hypothetical protein
MTIILTAETEKRLIAEASRRGIGTEQLAEQLIDAGLRKSPPPSTNQRSIDILNEWEAETATTDPDEIARRQQEFEEFKRELNETRLASDGPDARVPFP